MTTQFPKLMAYAEKAKGLDEVVKTIEESSALKVAVCLVCRGFSKYLSIRQYDQRGILIERAKDIKSYLMIILRVPFLYMS